MIALRKSGCLGLPPCGSAAVTHRKTGKKVDESKCVEKLVKMGFGRDAVCKALADNKGDPTKAVVALVAAEKASLKPPQEKPESSKKPQSKTPKSSEKPAVKKPESSEKPEKKKRSCRVPRRSRTAPRNPSQRRNLESSKLPRVAARSPTAPRSQPNARRRRPSQNGGARTGYGYRQGARGAA